MTVVCVLGMHRSGTSCLAGALQAAGLFAGEVVEWAPFNPKGNRENLRIRALNDSVLAASDGAWDRPPQELCWTRDHEMERAEILSDFEHHTTVWMFKDPRTALTLEFWQEGVADLVPVGTFRDPVAVVRSLQQRAREASDPQLWVDAGDALRLWVQYNQAIVRLRRRSFFPMLCFDEPQETYLGQLDAAVSWLQGRLGSGVMLRPESARRFHDGRLVRQRVSTGNPAHDLEVCDQLRCSADELYSELSEMARDAGTLPGP